MSDSPPQRPDCTVVGIGASAGGLQALEALFASVLPGENTAWVVVTRQHPGQSSMLDELIGKHTPLRMVNVTGRRETLCGVQSS